MNIRHQPFIAVCTSLLFVFLAASLPAQQAEDCEALVAALRRGEQAGIRRQIAAMPLGQAVDCMLGREDLAPDCVLLGLFLARGHRAAALWRDEPERRVARARYFAQWPGWLAARLALPDCDADERRHLLAVARRCADFGELREIVRRDPSASRRAAALALVQSAAEDPDSPAHGDPMGIAGARATADRDPWRRLEAIMALRRRLGVSELPWQRVAVLLDADTPSWPVELEWPKTARERARMWVDLGLAAMGEDAGPVGPRLHRDALRVCLGNAAREGSEGQAVLLDAIEGTADAVLRESLCRSFHAAGVRAAATWAVARDPRAQAVMLRLLDAEDAPVAELAFALLDQAMALPTRDPVVAAALAARALAALQNVPVKLCFERVQPKATICVLPPPDRERWVGGPANLDAVVVMIAARAGDFAPLQAILAHCEPFLRQPRFGDVHSDFAWTLVLRVASRLDDETRARLGEVVRRHAGPNADQVAIAMVTELGRCLARGPDAEPTRPHAWPPTAWQEWREKVASLPSPLFSWLAPPRPAAAPIERRERELQRLGAEPVWSPEQERDVIAATFDPRPEVRLVAYGALRTRDPELWPCAWLLHEVCFDPDAAVRALADPDDR